MRRAIIKGCLLGVIFMAALMLISTIMNQGNTDMTTEMGEATFPVVAMSAAGYRVTTSTVMLRAWIVLICGIRCSQWKVTGRSVSCWIPMTER